MSNSRSVIKPEAVLLGIILAVLFAASNAYLGLFAGMTVSASIPAALITLLVLRRVSATHSSNLVQTAASAGEAVAAGAVFTLPALILSGYYQELPYLECTAIVLGGGLLGVVFTIPLRRSLLTNNTLSFPEGVATAEVIKTGEKGNTSVGPIVFGTIAAALTKLLQGMFFVAGSSTAVVVGLPLLSPRVFAITLSPALAAVGTIVGSSVVIAVALGGILSWWIIMPFLAEGLDLSVLENHGLIWSKQIRYVGVGAMLVAAISTILPLITPILRGFAGLFSAGITCSNSRDDLSTAQQGLLTLIGFCTLFFALRNWELSWENTIYLSIFLLLTSYVFSAVGGYLSGLVGSSNSPISGLTIVTILCAALLLKLSTDNGSVAMVGAAIIVGAVICCAAAIGCDNMQDLKAGQLLNTSPRSQQLMQLLGVFCGAVVIVPIISLLQKVYGFGTMGPNPLAAPQAELMRSVASGVLSGDLPLNLISIGAIIGLALLAVDQYLKRQNADIRLPVMAVAVGMYLPLELDLAILAGGLIAMLRRKKSGSTVLVASGIITGEALVGILIAIPAALGIQFATPGSEVPFLGSILFVGVLGFIYKNHRG